LTEVQYAYEMVPAAAFAPCAVLPFLHSATPMKLPPPVHFTPAVLLSCQANVHRKARAPSGAADAVAEVAATPDAARTIAVNALASTRFIKMSPLVAVTGGQSGHRQTIGGAPIHDVNSTFDIQVNPRGSTSTPRGTHLADTSTKEPSTGQSELPPTTPVVAALVPRTG
jgi:hypothetical protein